MRPAAGRCVGVVIPRRGGPVPGLEKDPLHPPLHVSFHVLFMRHYFVSFESLYFSFDVHLNPLHVYYFLTDFLINLYFYFFNKNIEDNYRLLQLSNILFLISHFCKLLIVTLLK